MKLFSFYKACESAPLGASKPQLNRKFAVPGAWKLLSVALCDHYLICAEVKMELRHI